jgi:hypothetical protein
MEQFKAPEQFRVQTGMLATSESAGNNGYFIIPRGKDTLAIIASDGMGWEHVSVSLDHRTPTWEEMCTVKDLFWSPEARVVQFHPPHSEYVNMHPYTLHLWRAPDREFVHPPSVLVGY